MFSRLGLGHRREGDSVLGGGGGGITGGPNLTPVYF